MLSERAQGVPNDLVTNLAKRQSILHYSGYRNSVYEGRMAAMRKECETGTVVERVKTVDTVQKCAVTFRLLRGRLQCCE
jgi:hypothetical protein